MLRKFTILFLCLTLCWTTVACGGGGSSNTQVVPQPGTQTAFPDLPSEDSSIVSMEYKYRITMGASV